MKPKHYYLDLYDMHYYFFIRWPEEIYNEYVAEKFPGASSIDDHSQAETEFLEDHEPKTILIWVKDDIENSSALVHECVHAANYTLDWVDVRISRKNDEALAYLVELLWGQATKEDAPTH